MPAYITIQNNQQKRQGACDLIKCPSAIHLCQITDLLYKICVPRINKNHWTNPDFCTMIYQGCTQVGSTCIAHFPVPLANCNQAQNMLRELMNCLTTLNFLAMLIILKLSNSVYWSMTTFTAGCVYPIQNKQCNITLYWAVLHLYLCFLPQPCNSWHRFR